MATIIYTGNSSGKRSEKVEALYRKRNKETKAITREDKAIIYVDMGGGTFKSLMRRFKADEETLVTILKKKLKDMIQTSMRSAMALEGEEVSLVLQDIEQNWSLKKKAPLPKLSTEEHLALLGERMDGMDADTRKAFEKVKASLLEEES